MKRPSLVQTHYLSVQDVATIVNKIGAAATLSRLFDTDPVATRKLMDNLRHTALRLTACASIAEAVRGATVFVQYEPQTRIEGDLQQLPAEFVGQWMSLVPELLDPKDLFSLIRPDLGSLAPASPRAARVSAVAGAHIKTMALAV